MGAMPDGDVTRTHVDLLLAEFINRATDTLIKNADVGIVVARQFQRTASRRNRLAPDRHQLRGARIARQDTYRQWVRALPGYIPTDVARAQRVVQFVVLAVQMRKLRLVRRKTCGHTYPCCFG